MKSLINAGYVMQRFFATFAGSRQLAILLTLFVTCSVNADHGSEHTNPVSTPGGGTLSVSPSIIVNEGVVRYTYTPPANFPDSYPSWERLTYRNGTLYYTQGYRPSDPLFYFFRPVRWGTFSFVPNRDRCPPVPDNATTEQILELGRQCDALIGCTAGDRHCELKVSANRREGEDWRGYFWPNCRAQYYLGPFPETTGGGSQAQSRINLFMRNGFEGFDAQITNPLTLTSTGPLPDCPDPDPVVVEDPDVEFSCEDNNGDSAYVEMEIDSDMPTQVNFRAEIFDVCATYGSDFDFGGGDAGGGDCDPDVEFCEDEIDACVDQSTLDWSFGDGGSENFASAYDDVSHVYEEAGEYIVTATVQPFGVTTQCELKLKEPDVRVDVQPIGTKLVITPEGIVTRRTTVGSAFEMNVVVSTTSGFGDVKNVTFDNENLLQMNEELFSVLESPELPILPADFPPETEIFNGRFVVESLMEGEGDFDAPVSYDSTEGVKQANDTETVQAGGGLVVNVYASPTIKLSQTNFEKNAFSVRAEIENSGASELSSLTYERGGLLLMAVPGSSLPVGDAQLLKPFDSALPATLAPGEKYETSALLEATAEGALRLGLIVSAEDEEGNYYEVGKGADVRIVDDTDSFEDEKQFWREVKDLVYEYLASAQASAEELEGRGSAMINHMMETAAANGDLAAAGQAIKDSCSAPAALFPAGKPASEVSAEQGVFAKKLNEKAYIPDFIKSAFSEQERAANPAKELLASQVLARIIASEEATTEFVQENVETLGALGSGAGFISVRHNRELLANKVVGALKDFDQANEEGLAIMYNAFVNDDPEAANLIESAFVDLADRQETAVRNKCQEIADETQENLDLLADGKFAEYQFKTDKKVKKAGLEFIADVYGGLGSQKLLREGAERVSKSAVGQFAQQTVDNSKAHLRDSFARVNRRMGNYKGKADEKVFDSTSGAAGAAQKRRTRADTSAPENPPAKARSGSILGDPDDDFPGFIGGLSPTEQQAMQDIAGALDNEVLKYANALPEGPTKRRLLDENGQLRESIEIQLTPTNQFSSPEWRKRKGLPPVSPKEETMKAKSIGLDDIALGVPERFLGRVAIYDPTKAYNAMSAADKQRYRSRYLEQIKTWEKYQDETTTLRQNIDRATKPVARDENGNFITRVDAQGRPDPNGTPIDNVFFEDAPTHKHKEFTTDAQGNRVVNLVEGEPVQREIFQYWKKNVEEVDAIGGEIISFDDLSIDLPGGGNPFVGGDIDGHMIGFLSGEKIPGPLQSKLRLVFRNEARRRASDPGGRRNVLNGDLRFADHGFTGVGLDWLAAYDKKRIEYLVERTNEKRGRELFKEWIDYQNDEIRRKNPTLSEEELAPLLKDFDKEAESIAFGTKLTSVTSNNVRVVDGDSRIAERVIRRNSNRRAGEGS